MNKKKILAVPEVCFWSVAGICLLGIIIGSVLDFRINELLANKTSLGTLFATYGSYFPYCLYPAAGACLFVGLKKKGERYKLLAWVLLVIGFFMAVYYSNNYNGKAVRALLGYSAGESSAFISVLSWLFWVVLYSWVPLVLLKPKIHIIGHYSCNKDSSSYGNQFIRIRVIQDLYHHERNPRIKHNPKEPAQSRDKDGGLSCAISQKRTDCLSVIVV